MCGARGGVHFSTHFLGSRVLAHTLFGHFSVTFRTLFGHFSGTLECVFFHCFYISKCAKSDFCSGYECVSKLIEFRVFYRSKCVKSDLLGGYECVFDVGHALCLYFCVKFNDFRTRAGAGCENQNVQAASCDAHLNCQHGQISARGDRFCVLLGDGRGSAVGAGTGHATFTQGGPYES